MIELSIEPIFTVLLKISHDVLSGSEVTPCNKIDKPLVVCRFSGKSYDVHNTVAYMIKKLNVFYPRNELSK